MSRYKKNAKVVTPDADLARWCAALAAPSMTPDPVPPGWFSVERLAKKIGKSKCATQARVRRMAAAGLAEKKMFRIQLSNYVRPVPHYRLK